MSIEIIPSGASAVVTDHKHHENDRERFGNADRFAQVARDTKDARYDTVLSSTTAGSAGVLATKDARYDSVLASTTAGSAGVLATTVAGSAGVLATKDSRFEVIGAATVVATADALASAHSDEENQENFMAMQKQISDSATSTLAGFKDLTALSYQIEGRALLEAAKNQSMLSIQADRNWAASNLQAVTFAAAAQLEAQKNAAASALALAECCCELKEKMGDEGQKVKDLINSITQQDLRDRATRSETALAAYFSAKVAPTTPVVA